MSLGNVSMSGIIISYFAAKCCIVGKRRVSYQPYTVWSKGRLSTLCEFNWQHNTIWSKE